MKNAERFTGFAGIYESARPKIPEYPVKALCRYLGKQPETVVDLGCGTGLSTEIWKNHCKRAVGIEPSGDMLKVADKKANDVIQFRQGTGEKTGLPDSCADIVVCSQSFHWMEPKAALCEANRILKAGGVFAVIDCDWPAVTKWQAEKAYMELYGKIKQIEGSVEEISESFVRYPKSEHLKNIAGCGYFVYTRELLFANAESCTKSRFKNIIMSQGSLQTILKKRPELILEDIEKFNTAADELFEDDEFEIEFCYRMRIGIKA